MKWNNIPCTNTCQPRHTHTHTHTHTSLQSTQIYTYTHTILWVDIHTHSYTHSQTHIHMDTCTHIHLMVETQTHAGIHTGALTYALAVSPTTDMCKHTHTLRDTLVNSHTRFSSSHPLWVALRLWTNLSLTESLSLFWVDTGFSVLPSSGSPAWGSSEAPKVGGPLGNLRQGFHYYF